jgi:pimeloyl-ACP methyl ester carboxylesterase
MIFGPINLLLYPLFILISLCFLGGGIYFIWGWYEGVLAGIGFLAGGIALVIFSFFGRPLMLLLLGRRRGAARTGNVPEGQIHRIARPGRAEIVVEELGPADGPTLILTHGLGVDGMCWNYVKERLARQYRLFIWDLAGFGRSRGPAAGPFTMEMFADDLHAVVEMTGDGPVVLAGHSLGGMILLTYCKRYPEAIGTRVTGLVLAQTSYTNPVKTARFASLLTALQRPVLQPLCLLMIGLSPIFWLLNLQSYLSGMMHLATDLTGFRGVETSEQLEFVSRFSLTNPPASTGRAMLAMFRYEAADVLGAIQAPALVITGDSDIVTLPSAGEHIAQSILRAELSELKNAGHMGLIEQYSAFAEIIETRVGGAISPDQAVRRTA